MFKQFDLDYKKEALLKIYEKHSDAPVLTRNEFHFLEFQEIISYAPVIELFETFGDIFGATHPNTASFARMVKNGGPHIPHGHNGMIIFPIIGKFNINFYSYTAPVTNGRPTFVGSSLEPTKHSELMSSKVSSVVVDKPTAYNGLVIHNHEKTDEDTVFFALKVPQHIEWESVLEAIDRLGK